MLNKKKKKKVITLISESKNKYDEKKGQPTNKDELIYR